MSNRLQVIGHAGVEQLLLAVELREEGLERQAQGDDDLRDVVDADVHAPTLNPSVVAPPDLRLRGEGLLRDAALLAEPANRSSETKPSAFHAQAWPDVALRATPDKITPFTAPSSIHSRRFRLNNLILAMLLALVACSTQHATTVRDVLAHQDTFTDSSSIELSGRLTAPVAAPLFGLFIGRYLVQVSGNGEKDSIITLIPVPADTFPIARDIRLRGRVRGVSEFGGLLRVGPVLLVEAPEHAAGAGRGARP